MSCGDPGAEYIRGDSLIKTGSFSWYYVITKYFSNNVLVNIVRWSICMIDDVIFIGEMSNVKC